MAGAPLSRREQRKKEIHKRILRSSHALFVEKGYDDTTINDILAASGVARATFFSYFPSKIDLLDLLCDEMSRIGRIRAAGIAAKNWPVERKIRTYFKEMIQETRDTNDFAKVLLRHSFSRIDNRPAEERDSGIESGFVDLMRDAYEKGELDTSYSLEMLAQIVNGIFASLILKLINEPNYPVVSRTKVAADLAIKAISRSE